MTKEELYEMTLLPVRSKEEQDFQNAITDFIDNYVCIPKGENRHKYADVIHYYAEGLSQIEVLRTEGWVAFKQSGMCLCIGDEYRIKPYHPVYEWQWCVIMDNETASIYGYHTEETINDIFKERSKFKIEATKRERK